MLFQKLFNTKKAFNDAAVGYQGLIEVTDDLRKQVQVVLFDMYKDMYKACDKLGITLYLCGGTALGAVRHKGFLPWDDDFDVALSRSDYNKFKHAYKQSDLYSKYILNAPNYSKYPKARFPQLIKRGTVFEEIGDDAVNTNLKGFKIDIFIIDDTSNNRVFRTFKGLVCNMEEFIASKVSMVENHNEDYRRFVQQASKGTYYISFMIGKLFSFFGSRTWLNLVDKSIQGHNPNSKYCTIATGRGHYFGELLPRDIFYPSKEVDFCDGSAKVFHNVDRYLSNLYGTDYMKIPPKEKRERHFITKINFGQDKEKAL